MKLLRIKITDSNDFRSLPPDFEYYLRSERTLREEEARMDEGFAPFICAGPNGSGKSNLLEALASIFFQLEVHRVQRRFLPESFPVEGQESSIDLDDKNQLAAFELDYMIRISSDVIPIQRALYAHVCVVKTPGASPVVLWVNEVDFAQAGDFALRDGIATDRELEFLLPQYVLGYSSGENEILSLPFFKLRFVQFDEYWNCLRTQLPYPGHPETRLSFIDTEFSQAILLCNLLFEQTDTLRPFREDIGIEELKEFRILIRRSISIEPEQLDNFDNLSESEHQERRSRISANNPEKTELQQLDLIRAEIVKNNSALRVDTDDSGIRRYRVNVMHLLEGDKKSSLMVNGLMRCATLAYVDDATDTLILDYWVNEATREAFRNNFDDSPVALFQAFQVLLMLNLYAASEALKADLYRSTSHYVGETVPTLASDQRIMRFKFVRFTKHGVSQPMMLKDLSDGEHQLLHALGLCSLFRNTNSLFLLDEPETHFNPDWRANFISQLRQCLSGNKVVGQEMLITTHTPFLISDSRPEKVLVFSKDSETEAVIVRHPEYNTLGASINKITMETFRKKETIGVYAQSLVDEFRKQLAEGKDKKKLLSDIDHKLGDSIEKVLLVKTVLDSMEQ